MNDEQAIAKRMHQLPATVHYVLDEDCKGVLDVCVHVGDQSFSFREEDEIVLALEIMKEHGKK